MGCNPNATGNIEGRLPIARLSAGWYFMLGSFLQLSSRRKTRLTVATKSSLEKGRCEVASG
jgi:hypothetical protein